MAKSGSGSGQVTATLTMRGHARTRRAPAGWLTVREVAPLLGVNEDTVRRWCRIGTFRGEAIMPAGERGGYWIPVAAVARLLGVEPDALYAPA